MLLAGWPAKGDLTKHQVLEKSNCMAGRRAEGCVKGRPGVVLGGGGVNEEINVLTVISLLEHSKSWGWDWPCPPDPPSYPPSSLPSLGDTAAPAATGCSPHPICDSTPHGCCHPSTPALPSCFPFTSRCSPASPQCRQDEAGDWHVPTSMGSFIGTS